MILCDLVSEHDTDVLVLKATLQCIADLVARENFAVDVDAVTRCLDVEDAMVRDVQCLAQVAPKGDDRVILPLAARRGDPSFLVSVWVMQVWPAVAEQGDPRLPLRSLDVTKVGTSGPDTPEVSARRSGQRLCGGGPSRA